MDGGLESIGASSSSQTDAENTGSGIQEGIAIRLRVLVRLLAQHRNRQGNLCLPVILQFYPLNTPLDTLLDQKKGRAGPKGSFLVVQNIGGKWGGLFY